MTVANGRIRTRGDTIMSTRFLRLKMLALLVSGALLPGFIVSCEKAVKTVQLGFLEGLGFNAAAGG